MALYCQKRYYPIYIIVTIGLCFVSAIWDPSITVFYILPSMITGFIFALFTKLKMSNIYLIVIPSLIQLAFSYLGLYLSYLLTGIHALEVLQKFLALEDFKLYYVIAPSLVFTICLIQSLFSYMIIKDELPKFGYEINAKSELFYINVAFIGLLIIGIIVMGLFEVTLVGAYLCLFIAAPIAIQLCIDSCINKSKLMIVLNSVSLGLTVVIFSCCYQYLVNGQAILIFGVFYLLTTILAIINKHLLNARKIATI